MKISISTKINSIIICVVSSILLVYGYLEYQNKIGIENKRLQQSLFIISNRLSKTLAYPVWNLDFQTISNFIEAEMGDKNIYSIIIYNKISGRILSGKIRGRDWTIHDASKRPLVSQSMFIQRKAISFIGKPIANLEIFITNRFESAAIISQIEKLIKKMLLLLFLIVVTLALAINNSVARPVKKLTRIFEKISSGSFKEPIDIKRNDELGILSESLAHMRDTIVDKITSLNHEITERKHAEEALHDSENWLKMLLGSLQAGVIVIDSKTGKIVECNRSAMEMIGAPEDRIIGVYYKEHIRSTDMDERSVGAGQKAHRSDSVLTTIGGNKIPVVQTASKIKLKEAEYIIESFIDISERKRLELQLQRAQKMEALGLLAGGVAHDLNNVLSGIVSYPDLILMDLPDTSPLVAPIRAMQSSGQRAAAIVQDLLTLARRGVNTETILNLNDLIYDYLKSPEHLELMIRYPDLRIETNLEKNLLNISGSSLHLSKTIMNLVYNAAEAQSSDGYIMISTANQYIDTPLKGYEDIHEGDYSVFTISDKGAGIAPEDLNKIFEPFYTKKFMGKSGTGLGMAVVWGTVQDHNGYIDSESKIGEGTTFHLYFPVVRAGIGKKNASIPLKELMGNKEKILIVDDIEEQREIATKIFSKLNYSVTSVPSGEDAVKYMKKNSVDLLLLDMIMSPGINGYETYKRIVELHPGQKAIIASGFSETKNVKAAQELGAGQYLRKPYTLEKIGLAVKQELGR